MGKNSKDKNQPAPTVITTTHPRPTIKITNRRSLSLQQRIQLRVLRRTKSQQTRGLKAQPKPRTTMTRVLHKTVPFEFTLDLKSAPEKETKKKQPEEPKTAPQPVIETKPQYNEPVDRNTSSRQNEKNKSNSPSKRGKYASEQKETKKPKESRESFEENGTVSWIQQNWKICLISALFFSVMIYVKLKEDSFGRYNVSGTEQSSEVGIPFTSRISTVCSA
jgi:hypothetical protein